MNRTVAIGNLTRDPEGRQTHSGKNVANFGVAINGRRRDDQPLFIDVECWGQTAEFVVQYLQKGDKVAIDGRLKMDTWQDRNTGENRQRIRVVADSVESLRGRRDDDQRTDQEQRAPGNRTAHNPWGANGNRGAYTPGPDGRPTDDRNAPPPPPFPDDGDSIDDIPF
jgi:single-strand DNA-binding protein